MRICAAPGCEASLEDRNSQAECCSGACRAALSRLHAEEACTPKGLRAFRSGLKTAQKRTRPAVRASAFVVATLVFVLAAVSSAAGFTNGHADTARDLAQIHMPGGNIAYLSKTAAASMNTMRL